jgi:hypothetical protein
VDVDNQSMSAKQRRAQMTPEQQAKRDKEWKAFREQFQEKLREEYHLPPIQAVKPLPSLEKLGRPPKPNQ